MSSVPELKKKKIARDAELAKAAIVSAAKAEADEVESIKTITAKAKSYEEEYEAVSFNNHYILEMITLIDLFFKYSLQKLQSITGDKLKQTIKYL